MNRAWSLADVIDFEAHVSRDGDEPGDRRIFEEKIAPLGVRDRREVFHAWLEARRAEAGAEQPGEQFLTGWHTLLTVAVVAGLLIGGLVASPALIYRGQEPVNVVGFLACTLGLQWALMLGALVLGLMRRASLLPTRWRPLQALVRALLVAIGAGLRRLPGDQRLQLGAIFGRLDRRREIYGSLAIWPLLVSTQLFAVCFNVGVLTTLLWRVAAHEQRFGWQTTLDIDSERAGRMVATFAAPWQWAPNAHPSVDQVSATRYAPHQSHATLPADAMRAWWPFLFWSVGFYGLAVRGALLACAALKLRLALRALRFDHAEANALWRRLRGPLVRSAESSPPPGDTPDSAPPGQRHEGACLGLVSHELTLAEGALREQLARSFRLQLVKMLPVKIDQRHACAAQLAAVREAAPVNVVVVIPSDRDPIVAITLFLSEVAAAASAEGSVLVLLSETIDTGRTKLWRDFAARERLRVDVEEWRTA
ncbi:MAG: DUF2868 domain-containing protein [Chthoniobacteraceae bacterium]